MKKYEYQATRAYAAHLDSIDPQKEFYIPQIEGKDSIYFCGNF